MSAVPKEATPLLRVDNLVKQFPIKGGLLQREVGRVHAVDGVSFDLKRRRDAWAWSVNPAAARAPPDAASCA